MACHSILWYTVVLLSLELHQHCEAAAHPAPPRGGGHPKLFFGPEDVQTLRTKAATTHSFLTKRIIEAKTEILSNSWGFFPPISFSKFASRWNEVYGNNLPVLGLYALLFPNDTAALNGTIEYLHRMALYPSWYVTNAPTDEVPLSHSLLGFATAFDFIHPYLSAYQRKAFQAKVAHQTELLYKASRHQWWGKSDIQNHVFTNYLALFVGALLSRGGREEAEVWLAWARSRLEYNMDLLKNIQDGSLHEGVGYGGYSARSLTQYCVLVHRHFGINHFQHPWLKQHFFFYYHTTLPGFTKSVGIADTNANWFYGPESQLVFLDSFVLRTGWANWLARAIRGNNKQPDQPKSFRYVTLHTEFIWYDSNIGEVPPPKWGTSATHLFQDWGVATLRLGNMTDPRSSFFYLKSGHVFGRGLHRLVKQGSIPITSLNSGHEHPDQNTVIISMDGMTVFSDDLYNFKYSHTNNVLLFGPAASSICTPGWAGQIGDCRKWMNFKKAQEKLPYGEVNMFKLGDTYVLSGEAAAAYPEALGLKCFTRFLVVLDRMLAVLIDFLALYPDSPVQRVGTFFNNHERRFAPLSRLVDSVEGMEITGYDKKSQKQCEVLWKDHTHQRPVLSISSVSPSNMSNANISWAFQSKKYLTMAYVISCNQPSISNFSVVESSKGIFSVSFAVNSSAYSVTLANSNQCPNVTAVAVQNKGAIRHSDDSSSNFMTSAIMILNYESNARTHDPQKSSESWVCDFLAKVLIVLIVLFLFYTRCRILRRNLYRILSPVVRRF